MMRAGTDFCMEVGVEAEEGVGLSEKGTAQDNKAALGMDEPADTGPVPSGSKKAAAKGKRSGATAAALVIALLALGIGLGVGFLLWDGALSARAELPDVRTAPLAGVPTPGPVGIVLAAPVSLPIQGPALPPAQYVARLPESFTLPVTYGRLGPALIKAGAIDLDAFLAIYTDGGKPLSAEQQAILTQGSDKAIVIDRSSAHFLLNFFWAVGLANRNAILLDGPIQDKGADTVGQYASTGGWTLAARPVMEIFASQPLIKLTPAQQQRLETVAEGVYRPCCGNSTAFPDCNHGMAMLGILELMAAGDASEDEMFEAAKYVSAFWFPKEMTQAAAYYKLAQGQDFAAIDPRRIVSRDIFSMAGAQSVQQWLTNTGHSANMGHLGQPQDAGGSCGA